MVTVKINNITTEARENETILAVAKRLGINIPTLCYHAKLGPFGACRICLVEVEPGNRLVASCITKVFNNMVVKTDSEMAIKARKINLELLLARHPSDCLVCEKGGECELQNVAFAIGTSGRFEKGENRITEIFGVHPHDYNVDDTRSIIERDMNKCILCKRCIRVCHEVQGVGAINFSNRGYKMQMGAFYGRALDCEFCGQCVDICPVGALVNKLPKYRARVWELKPVKSTCTYCGCGCTQFLNVKDNEIIKVTARMNVGINQGNLCARGRYGIDFVGSQERLKTPLIKNETGFREVSWKEALDYSADRLKQIRDKSGAESIAGLGSARCTNEENYLLQKLMRVAIGSPHLDNSVRLEHAPALNALTNSLGWPAATNSFADIAKAKTILLIGANVTETHPIVGLHIKHAVNKLGVRLLLVEAGPSKMDLFSELNMKIHHGTEVALLNGMANVLISKNLIAQDFIDKNTEGFDEVKKAVADYTPLHVEEITGIPAKQVELMAQLYAQARPATVYFGAELSQSPQGGEAVQALINLALMTGNIGIPGGGVNPLRVHNNIQGSCDMGMLPDYFPGYQSINDKKVRECLEELWGTKLPLTPGLNMKEIFKEIDRGTIKALYVMGENPVLGLPYPEQVERVLKKLQCLVVQDIFMTETAQLANVVLPGTSYAEKDGTFTNSERRVQRIRQAIPEIKKSVPDWKILADIFVRLCYHKPHYQSANQIMEEIRLVVPIYGGVNYFRLDEEGLQWPCLDQEDSGTDILYHNGFPGGKAKFQAVQYQAGLETGSEYPYLITAGKFHSGTMSRYSAALAEIKMVV